jgi:hypothetical protein
LDALRECIAIFEVIDPKRWANTARRRLAELLREAGRAEEAPLAPDETDDPETQMADAMRQLAQLYAQGGADAVRELLAGNVPDEVIDALLAQFAAAAATLPAAQPSTLPEETIKGLAGNTIAVRTGVPEKREEWRGVLASLRADFAGRGADWAIEVAFADALLAIVDGGAPTLPPDNPYAGVVRDVVAAIAGG